MLPSASYFTSTLFLFFPDVFGAGVCNDRVKAMPAMLKVKFKMAAQRTTALGGGGGGSEALGGILRLQVSCFLVKEKDTGTESQA